MNSSAQFLTELDRNCKGTRRAIEQLHYAAHKRGPGADFFAAWQSAERELRNEHRLAFGDPKERMLNNPSKRATLEALVRKCCEAPLNDNHKAVLRILGEDTSPGSDLVNDDLVSDLWDLLALYGAWASLGVRPVRSKQGIFPVATVMPSAVFLIEGGDPIPEDTLFAGTSATGKVGVIGALIGVTRRLLEDTEGDLMSAVLDLVERGCNARLDYAVFNGDGTADTTNGSITGLFQNGDVPSSVAANGNTTIQTLEEDDFLSVLAATPAPVFQRKPAWWANPLSVVAAMKIKDASGKRIVQTPLEAQTGGLFSICGFPVNLVAQAPSTNAAGAKPFRFGEPAAYAVGIRQAITVESSNHFGWDTLQVTFRTLLKATGKMRDANGFVALTLAAA